MKLENGILTLAPGESVTVQVPEIKPEPQPEPKPTPKPNPEPKSPVVDDAPAEKLGLLDDLTAGNLKPGATYDLGGKTIVLKKSLVAPKGSCEVRNGRIEYAGSGKKTGDPSMACFQVKSGSQLFLSNMAFGIPTKCTVAHLSTGGNIVLSGIWQERGGLLWCNGGESARVVDCSSAGVPDKYWLCNFSSELKRLTVMNSLAKPIRQGDSEAAIRIMQVNDSHIEGVKTIPSGFKQDVQDRPGGPPGTVWEKHVWVDCDFGTVDLGNFQDETDKSYPFGRLKLSEWRNCKVKNFHKTFKGQGAYGIDQLVIK